MKKYIDRHTEVVRQQIMSDINETSFEIIVNKYLAFHLSDRKSSSFQDYYFLTLENEEHFINSPSFFRIFKKQYSLQGIDNIYLDFLERNKINILSLLKANNLEDIYFDYFAKAKIKHGDKIINKDLGSFFAKIVHTFKPTEYCALDNPIKKYFGLQHESFFIALVIISSAYKTWAIDNKRILSEIRHQFKIKDKKNIIQHNSISDLKLLDLIYWSKANIH